MKTKLVFIILFVLIVVAVFYAREAVREQRMAAQQKAAALAKAPETTITIIEGWDNKDIGNLLENKNIISSQDFLKLEKAYDASAYPLLDSKPVSADLEGFLFPDTYQVFTPTDKLTQTDAANLVMKKFLDNFSAKFTPQMVAQAKADNMSVYQIITLASIVEKETGLNATSAQQKEDLATQRNIVAGIFYNRLQAGMALQSDATVNFVTGKSDPAVSTQDAAIDSPYNTYKYKGLPPGPICNPSLSSIMAVLYPTKSNYFYFLDAPDGQAYYAATYDEHLQNKAKYLK